MHLFRLMFLASVVVLLSACASAPESKDYTSFRKSDPRSILVVPVINHSAEVDAANYFLTTLAIPLAERGFYVFPINMVRDMMESDGLGDPYLVHSADSVRLCSLFGSEGVLYVEIFDWRSQYAVLASNIIVHFLYTLKDCHTGELLWQEEQPYVYSRSGGSGNIFADLIATAVTSAIDSASSDYTGVAMAANAEALLVPGQGLPNGPYSPSYNQDIEQFQSTGTGKLSNAVEVATSLGRLPDEAAQPDMTEQSDSPDAAAEKHPPDE